MIPDGNGIGCQRLRHITDGDGVVIRRQSSLSQDGTAADGNGACPGCRRIGTDSRRIITRCRRSGIGIAIDREDFAISAERKRTCSGRRCIGTDGRRILIGPIPGHGRVADGHGTVRHRIRLVPQSHRFDTGRHRTIRRVRGIPGAHSQSIIFGCRDETTDGRRSESTRRIFSTDRRRIKNRRTSGHTGRISHPDGRRPGTVSLIGTAERRHSREGRIAADTDRIPLPDGRGIRPVCNIATPDCRHIREIFIPTRAGRVSFPHRRRIGTVSLVAAPDRRHVLEIGIPVRAGRIAFPDRCGIRPVSKVFTAERRHVLEIGIPVRAGRVSFPHRRRVDTVSLIAATDGRDIRKRRPFGITRICRGIAGHIVVPDSRRPITVCLILTAERRHILNGIPLIDPRDILVPDRRRFHTVRIVLIPDGIRSHLLGDGITRGRPVPHRVGRAESAGIIAVDLIGLPDGIRVVYQIRRIAGGYTDDIAATERTGTTGVDGVFHPDRRRAAFLRSDFVLTAHRRRIKARIIVVADNIFIPDRRRSQAICLVLIPKARTVIPVHTIRTTDSRRILHLGIIIFITDGILISQRCRIRPNHTGRFTDGNIMLTTDLGFIPKSHRRFSVLRHGHILPDSYRIFGVPCHFRIATDCQRIIRLTEYFSLYPDCQPIYGRRLLRTIPCHILPGLGLKTHRNCRLPIGKIRLTDSQPHIPVAIVIPDRYTIPGATIGSCWQGINPHNRRNTSGPQQ